ncbi:MAG: poly-beta-1,6-N-acetyl-D-glucosamine biosynthesis protein PgaD [Comamonadaceae bacterium]|nr:MAG: poly-beta-1,6-N-acetyl-D-glucosamine biosynthesis protein PgaD [Comamonadaceae bacterium]
MFSERKSRRKLADRRAAMPVIDAAHAPMGSMRRRWPRLAPVMFLWLKLLRPAAVVLIWLVAVRYAWVHFFGLPKDMPQWQEIALYGVVVLAIIGGMLLLAPLRRREVRSEPTGDAGESTISDISDFAGLSPDNLAQWQQAQRLTAHHDDTGNLRHADKLAPAARV